MSVHSASVIVACPHDAALNRVPTERLGSAARCGTCGRSLFQATPVDLTETGFERHAVKSDLPVVIDFWAAWCGPCRTMGPNFAAAASRLEPRVRLAKLDTEAQPAIASRFGIRGIPCLILIRKGVELGRTLGVMPTDAVVQWVDGLLPTASPLS